MMRSTKSGFTKSFPWRGRRAPTSCKRYLSVWPKRNSSERRHTNSWFLRVALGDSCRALPPFCKAVLAAGQTAPKGRLCRQLLPRCGEMVPYRHGLSWK